MFELQGFFEKYHLGCKSHLKMSFQFLGVKKYVFTSLNPFMFALPTFFGPNNNLLKRKLNLFD
jgi:hypothetical protein